MWLLFWHRFIGCPLNQEYTLKGVGSSRSSEAKLHAIWRSYQTDPVDRSTLRMLVYCWFPETLKVELGGWSWFCTRFPPVKDELFLPLSLAESQALGFFKAPTDNVDCNRCCINKDELNLTRPIICFSCYTTGPLEHTPHILWTVLIPTLSPYQPWSEKHITVNV